MIIKKSNGRYTLSINGVCLNADYFKIERLTEGSNNYLLWPDSHSRDFYLYNIEKACYILGGKKFKRTEYYSAHSSSFVAYRSDTNYAYIVYEDGDIDKNVVCKFIGEEYNGVRPIRTYGDKWLYYNCGKRKTAWRVENGLSLEDGLTLGRKLEDGCYIVSLANGGMIIYKYDGDRRRGYRTEHKKTIYDSIEKGTNSSYYICKRRNLELYDLLLCRNFRLLSNDQWTSPHFIFQDSYIFHNPNPNSSTGNFSIWKIVGDGMLPINDMLGWKNIRIYHSNAGLDILVDTDTENNKKVSVLDINNKYNELRERSASLYRQNTPEPKPDTTNNLTEEENAKDSKVHGNKKEEGYERHTQSVIPEEKSPKKIEYQISSDKKNSGSKENENLKHKEEIDSAKIQAKSNLKRGKEEIQENVAMPQLSKDSKVHIKFKDRFYALCLGGIWDIGEKAFSRKKYIKMQTGQIAILLSESNLISINYRLNENPHYRILGEGNDERFDQDFGAYANKQIEDKRSILLFKKGFDGKIHLIDEAKSCDHKMVSQTLRRKNSKSNRKVIVFDLVSLRRTNDWHLISDKNED